MKRLLFTMIMASALIISTLNSCSKDDSIVQTPSPQPTALILTTYQWAKAEAVFVCVFKNVIPAAKANSLIKIYLVTNGEEILINQAIRFMDGALWGTNTQTDVAINYRGNLEKAPYLNIKVVVD